MWDWGYTRGECGESGGDCRSGDDAARLARKGEFWSTSGGSGVYGGGLPSSRRCRLAAAAAREVEIELGPGCGAAAKSGIFAVYERALPLQRRAWLVPFSDLVRERVRGGGGGGVGGRRTGVWDCLDDSPELEDEYGDGDLLFAGTGTSGVSTLRRSADELCG